jgi:predicted RNase H-like nuclease (RuvC/YqgF family)
MTTQNDLSDWRIAALEKKLEEQHEEIEALRKEMNEREKERAREEANRLKWGIATLGTVVTTLLGIIWTFRKVIVGGAP